MQSSQELELEHKVLLHKVKLHKELLAKYPSRLQTKIKKDLATLLPWITTYHQNLSNLQKNFFDMHSSVLFQSTIKVLLEQLEDISKFINSVTFPSILRRNQELDQCKNLLNTLLENYSYGPKIGYKIFLTLSDTFWKVKYALNYENDIQHGRAPAYIPVKTSYTNYNDLPNVLVLSIYTQGLLGFDDIGSFLKYIRNYTMLNKQHRDIVRDAIAIKTAQLACQKIPATTVYINNFVQKSFYRQAHTFFTILLSHSNASPNLYVNESKKSYNYCFSLRIPFLHQAIKNHWQENVKILLNTDRTFLWDASHERPLKKPIRSKQNGQFNRGALINNQSALHVAARENNLDAALLLIQMDLGLISNPDYLGRLPLHLAIKHNHLHIAKHLITEHTIDFQNNYGESALFYALKANNFDAVMLLLDNHAAVDISDTKGNHPLHIAARYASSTITQLLIQRGAREDSVNNKGKLPIHFAAKNKEFGVDNIHSLYTCYPDAITHSDHNGNTPIFFATNLGLVRNADFIITHLKERNEPFQSHNANGLTPMHIAAFCNQHEIVKLLIERDPTTLNNLSATGITPIQFLWNRTLYKAEAFQTIKLLVELGADTTKGFVTNRHPNKTSLLDSAVLTLKGNYANTGNLELIRFLINKGIKLTDNSVLKWDSWRKPSTEFRNAVQNFQNQKYNSNFIDSIIPNLMKNTPKRWQKNPLTNKKVNILADFHSFLKSYQSLSPSQAVEQWSMSYSERFNENPFEILQTQRNPKTFTFFNRSFNPTHTNSTKLFLEYLRKDKIPDVLTQVLKNSPPGLFR